MGLTRLRSSADVKLLLSQPPQSWPAGNPKILTRPAKWYKQAQIIADIASQHEATVLLAHEYLFASRFAPRDRLHVIQVEHSKGGVHTEFLAANKRKNLTYLMLSGLAHEVMGSADQIIFPSRGAAELYAGNNPRHDVRAKTTIVHNGVPDPFDSCEIKNDRADEQTLTIVNVANHVSEKSIDFAIDGIALWKKQTASNLKLRFINFGQHGVETSRLEALSRQRGLAEECSFRGFAQRREVLLTMARADVFALTPQVAVFDLALLEAMGLAKPVLSTPVGGNVEALGENYFGYVRSPSDFAARLERLVQDQGFASTIGMQNRQRFLDRFTDRAMINGYLSVVSEALHLVDKRRSVAA
jgi:glycosyltransferase involved in cell wall biosynthesis